MKILTAFDQHDRGEIASFLETLTPDERTLAEKVFSACDGQDFEQAAQFCMQLLDINPDLPAVHLLLGQCLFATGDLRTANLVFSDLIQDHPDEEIPRIYYAMTLHRLGYYKEAVQQFRLLYPLDDYYPFFLNSYANTLQKLGKDAEARRLFREEASHFEETGSFATAEMLDGTFQNLLYLDVKLANGCYDTDMALYQRFLSAVSMDDSMKKHLVNTLIHWGTLLDLVWYRPKYRAFLDFISEKGVLAGEEEKDFLETAYMTLEFVESRTDSQAASFPAQFIRFLSELGRGLLSKDADDKFLIHSYFWYMCRYYPGHEAEIRSLAGKYPHTFRLADDFFARVHEDAEKESGRLLAEMLPLSDFKDFGALEKHLTNLYDSIQKQTKSETYVYDSDTPYRRSGKKIGRNDPCPCGSGKKYKNCCGKIE